MQQIELRDRNLGENIGLTVQLVGAFFVPLIVIAVVLNLPGLVLQLLMVGFDPGSMQGQDPGSVDWNAMGRFLGIAGASMVVNMVLYSITTAASTAIVAGAFTGQRQSIGGALALAMRRLLTVLMINLSIGLLMALIYIGGAVIVGLLAAVLGTAGVVIGVFFALGACIPLLAFVLVIFYLAVPAAVVEERRTFEALGRSSELAKGARWEILGFWLVLFLLLMAAGVISMVIPVLTGLDPNGYGFSVLTWLVGVAAGLFAVVGPVVMYFNLRVRREGFDVEALTSLVDRIGSRGR